MSLPSASASLNEILPADISNLQDFLGNLFARQQFTAHLLERSYQQPTGWLEIAVVAILIFGTFWLARYWQNKHPLDPENKWRPLHHIIQRLLWPLLMLCTGIAVLYIWNFFDLKAVWIRLLLMSTRWMILTRLILGILHSALPRQRMSDWLERFLAAALWLSFILWLTGIDDIIIKALQSIQLPVGSITLNLFTILTGLLWVGIVMVLAMWLANFIDGRLMKNERLDLNLRIVLSKITKTVLMVLSVLIALPLVGIDLTVLSVFGGALGVGIGFGLQKISSNYISGFIILGERSIRPGDRLTVNNFTGYVTQITARFVVLRNASGAEALIPNETFVTSTVINESYTGKALQNSLSIQVAYHTDLTVAMQILKDAASAQARVGTDPGPSVFLVNFADNGIDLQLNYWVTDPENGFLGLSSAIMLDIWKHFNENGIEFPFPQREVRILQDTPEPSEQAIKRAGTEAQSGTHSPEQKPETYGPVLR